MKVLAHCVVREGRKIVGAGNSPISSIQSLVLEAMSADKVMVEFALLKQGNSFTFKHKGKSCTVKPLHNHIDNY